MEKFHNAVNGYLPSWNLVVRLQFGEIGDRPASPRSHQPQPKPTTHLYE